jgi:CheY-like chemotaxis protein
MKILYVEDNDDNVYMLKNRLSRAGFTVVVATNGAQGIAMASSEQPDLILMDLTLPDIDGEEATRRIKADPATKGIPVIALTANAMSPLMALSGGSQGGEFMSAFGGAAELHGRTASAAFPINVPV